METRSFGVCEATILQTGEMRGESGDVGEDGGDVEGDRPEETGSEEAVHEPETREICHGELQAYLVARLQEQVARDGHDEEPKSEGVEDPLRLVDELQGYPRAAYGVAHDAEEIIGIAQLRVRVRSDKAVGPRVNLLGKRDERDGDGPLPGEDSL